LTEETDMNVRALKLGKVLAADPDLNATGIRIRDHMIATQDLVFV
jgi:hypothetical protein